MQEGVQPEEDVDEDEGEGDEEEGDDKLQFDVDELNEQER